MSSVWKGAKKLVGGVTDAIGLTGGGGSDDTGDAARDAARIQADYQTEALDYLKEVEELPQQYREGALTSLAGISGLEGGEGSQQDLIDRSRQSPLYAAIMGTQEAGEDAVMRNSAMTGGLRSGNMQDQLFTYNANLENTALNEAYNQELQGLQGLAGLPSNANNIASATAGIGQTLGQGEVAAANADAASSSGEFGNLMGLGSLGLSAYSAFSDRRLKKNIANIGRIGGYTWYSWDWNSVGESIGLTGSSQGVIADEVVDTYPEAVTLRNGFMFVDYGKLEDQNAATI